MVSTTNITLRRGGIWNLAFKHQIPPLRSVMFALIPFYGYLNMDSEVKKFIYYRTRVRSLGMLVSDSLTNSLRDV